MPPVGPQQILLRSALCLQVGPRDNIPKETQPVFIEVLVEVFNLPLWLLEQAPSFHPWPELTLRPDASLELGLCVLAISKSGSGSILHSSTGLGFSPTQIPLAFRHRYCLIYNVIL